MKEEPAEAIRITLLVTAELDQLKVPYVVVGSLASSLHGIPRSTNDVDLLAGLRNEHAPELARRLEGSFYADVDMMKDAIAHRSEFNLVHLATMFKLDVFVPGARPTSLAELSRGESILVDAGRQLALRVASPEDTIVHKLDWLPPKLP